MTHPLGFGLDLRVQLTVQLTTRINKKLRAYFETVHENHLISSVLPDHNCNGGEGIPVVSVFYILICKIPDKYMVC